MSKHLHSTKALRASSTLCRQSISYRYTITSGP
nr:MAG TPA: hypothetical protein [Microviridae sp.]